MDDEDDSGVWRLMRRIRTMTTIMRTITMMTTTMRIDEEENDDDDEDWWGLLMRMIIKCCMHSVVITFSNWKWFLLRILFYWCTKWKFEGEAETKFQETTGLNSNHGILNLKYQNFFFIYVPRLFYLFPYHWIMDELFALTYTFQ